MEKYEFENLEVRFDGTQEQADALRERAEALGYEVNPKFSRKYFTLYDDESSGFFNQKADQFDEETYDQFMTRTEQYLQPKTSPCQAHDNQTHIVDIDGEKWRVELVEKVNEPLTALEWIKKFEDDNKAIWEEMEAYAAYRLYHFKTHGV